MRSHESPEATLKTPTTRPGRSRAYASQPAFVVVLLLLAASLLGGKCAPAPPAVRITSPVNGDFQSIAVPGSIVVTGIVENVADASIIDITVNGVSVLPLAPDRTFSASVPLASAPDSGVYMPIVAQLTSIGGPILRDRVTLVLGEFVLDGDFSIDSVALRLTEAGLNEAEPLITSLVNLDLASLLPPGTLVIDNFCYQDSIFGCLGRVDVTIHNSPPPSIQSFGIDIDPMINFVAGDITLNNLAVTAKVRAVTGVGFTCYIDINAATTQIFADYGLSPDAIDPSAIDVSQLGSANLSFGGFSDSTDCSGFLGFIVEALVGLFIGDIQSLVEPALENFLNAADPNGNTPVAGAIEVALTGIEIAGPIGDAIGVSLETPLFAVDEDTGGITFGSDSRVLANLPDPDAPDLLASYHIDEPFPVFTSSLAPNGTPYEMAMCISTSSFNQLMRAEIESGLLRMVFAEFDFGTGLAPISAGLLSQVVPEFAFLDPAELLRFELRPTLAPVMTGDLGPNGELALLEVSHLVVAILPLVGDKAFVELAVDLQLGLDFSFAGSSLSVALGALSPSEVQQTILTNRMGTNEITLNILTPLLLGLALPELSSSLGSFPLPSFLGLELGIVDIDRNGEFVSLFFDLSVP
jgi:hypothetical protein